MDKNEYREYVLDELINNFGGTFLYDFIELLPLATAYIINLLKNKDFLNSFDKAIDAYYATSNYTLSFGICSGSAYSKNNNFLNTDEVKELRKDDVINKAIKTMKIEEKYIFDSMCTETFDVLFSCLGKIESDVPTYLLAAFEAMFLYGVLLGYEKCAL